MISDWVELPELNEIQKPHKQTRKAQTRKFLFYVLFYVLFLMYLILDFVAFQNELLIRPSSISKKLIHWFKTFFQISRICPSWMAPRSVGDNTHGINLAREGRFFIVNTVLSRTENLVQQKNVRNLIVHRIVGNLIYFWNAFGSKNFRKIVYQKRSFILKIVKCFEYY